MRSRAPIRKPDIFRAESAALSKQRSIRCAHADFWISDLRAAFAALVRNDRDYY